MPRPTTFAGFWLAVIMTVSICLWAAMVFGTFAHLRNVAGGLEPFDLRPFGYSPSQARALLQALGESGREFYARVQLQVDTAYFATYAISRCWMMWWLTAPGRLRDAPISNVWRFAILAPSITTTTFDYFENIQIAAMLAAGPSVDAATVEAASRMTLLRSFTGAVNETFVLIFAVMVLQRWRRQRQT